jgi:hypothetical protein
VSCESPLLWPEGWPRCQSPQDSKYRFRRAGQRVGGPDFWSLDAARKSLEVELQRLGATDVIVSSNYKANSFGTMSESKGRPRDQGIAVYFELDGKPMVMAQDEHARAEENLRSLALAVEAMRQLERHGGGTMRQKAFTGFAALPPPPSCWQILGLGKGASEDAIDAAWRAKIRFFRLEFPAGDHPLEPGLNAARDEALRLVRK